MDEQWIPVVSGAVGAGGAIIGQIVAALFTASREKKAIKARREDDATALTIRRADERAAAFVDQKRELYAKVLRALDDDIRGFLAFFPKVEVGELSVSIPTGVLNDEAWQDLAADVDLLAPDIVKEVNACLNLLQAVDFAASFADFDLAKSKLTEVRKLRGPLRDAMRVSLNVG